MKRLFVTIAILACQLAPWSEAAAQLPAFPGAEGAGKHAAGGRNSGNVYVVSNLNDSGVGSLRHAIDSAPRSGRTIVFGVGGTINLQSDLRIDTPYITIAGQSAPAGGVTLARRALHIADTHDVIVQHIAVRPGDYYTSVEANYEPDSIWVSGSHDVILDHVSASWSTDEVLSVTHGSTDVTVQWSMITEALHNSYHEKGNHGYGSIFHGGEVTLHHNLYANNRSRNPALGNWDKSDPPAPAHLDIVNNVISNPGDRYSYSGSGDAYDVNWVGNYGVEGPDTSRENELFHPDNVDTRVYYEGNYYDSQADGLLLLSPASGRTLTGNYTLLRDPAATSSPPDLVAAPVAYAQVLSYAGAAAWRDPIDKRVINDVINQSGSHLDSQDEVGGWHYPARSVHQLDPDGLPDWWKTQNGFDPDDNSVGYQFAEDGYTQLEKYLHELSQPYLPPSHTTQLTLSTAFGAGADARVGEATGASQGDGGAQLATQWDSGVRDDLILLRFDLSQIEPGTVTDATLELTAYDTLPDGILRAYGLKHEQADQQWDEGAVELATAPGTAFDANSATRAIDPSELLLLGEFTSRGVDEGEVLSFTNPDLSVFLNLLAYREDGSSVATLVLERQDNSDSPMTFASKETDALASGATGAFAPRLVLQAQSAAGPVLAGDYNGDGVVDAADYTVWRDAAASGGSLLNETASQGVADAADYQVWRSNFAASRVGPTATVPEPHGLLLGLAAVVSSLAKPPYAAERRRSRPTLPGGAK